MFRLYANAIRFGAAVALILIAAAMLSPVRTGAAEPDYYARGSVSGAKFLALGLGKSAVIDLPADTKDVLVANPAIANAVVRSARRAYLIGVAVGQTSVIFFDGDGRHEWYFRTPDGETYETFAGRIGGWLGEQAAGVRIVVAHGIVTRVLRGLYAGLPRAVALSLPVPQDRIYRLADGRIEEIAVG